MKSSRKGRPENRTVDGFADRISWITENLDTHPRYLKFISPDNVDDNYEALADALKLGTYSFEDNLEGRRPSKRTLTKRTWTDALKRERPSPVILDWLCTLYPDLTRNWLLTPTFEDFLSRGKKVEQARSRWLPAIKHFANKRAELCTQMMKWYGAENFQSIDGNIIPLIAKPGWLRDSPLKLDVDTEDSFTTAPAHAAKFKAPILEGLKGDYSTYRGKEGYPARRTVFAKPQHNGEIFCAESIKYDDTGNFAGFGYRLGRYFDYLNTCEILGTELSDWILQNPQSELPKDFPFRGAPADVFDLTNRAAYPGINCLTIVKNYANGPLKRNDYYLVHKRDDTQLQAQWSLHVAPAGGHQGFSKSATVHDTKIVRTVVREFAEELFNKEELVKQFEEWRDFEEHLDIKTIADTFFWGRNPAAKIYLLGFGLDPVTIKPEVLCTIVIDWDIARQNIENPKFEFNWEFQTGLKRATRTEWLPLDRSAMVLDATGPRHLLEDRYLDPLPAGAACLLLTAKFWKELGLN